MGWPGRAAGALALATAGAVAGIAGAVPAAAATAQLTRAPYLTDVVGSVATVNWGTDSTGNATVSYGPVAAGCTGATATGTATPITVATRAEQQWTAQLTGLSPATSYCYQITQDGTALLTSTPHFTSAVASGAAGSFSFAVLGDWGEATNGVNTDQQKVLELVAKSGVQFALGTGDIGYGDASQTDYGDLQNTGGNSEVFRSGFWGEPGGSVPMFSAIGNHGWNSTFLQNWPQPTAVSSSSGTYSLDGSGNPQAWYAFDEGNARFYILEAAAGTASTQYADDDALHWTSSSPQVTWLRNDLASHPGALKIAVFHYPLWSDDGSDSDALLQRDLLPILDQYGVRMAFNGHSHIYERNNAYTGGTVNGLVSYVSGGAGADTEDVTQCSSYDAYAIGWSTSGTSCHAALPTAVTQVHHFLKVTVNGNAVTVTPTDENGNVFDQQSYDFAPSAPTGLAATAGDSHVTLSWTAPGSNGGSAISGYTVYRSTSPSAAGTAIASGIATTSYDDTTAAAATTYYYSVRATNAAGLAGPLSSQVSATPYAAPGAPTGLTATAGNDAVSLTWTAPASNGSTITSYSVYRSTDGSRGTLVGTPTTTSFNDSGLANGTTYYYTVTATNAAGPGPDSAQTSATPRAVPDAPTALTATSGNSTVSLTWTAPASNGSAITGYSVYRSTDGSKGNLVGTSPTTSFNDGGLTNGTTYYYTVTATNGVGEGPGSAQAPATPYAAPGAPTGLTATAGNDAVSLTWTAPASNGSTITGYSVYRSTDGSKGNLVGTSPTTSFTDSGLTNGTTYFYTVTATNAAGEGPGSSQVSATPRTIPDAPTALTATPGNSTVSLSWTAPASNGSAITSYRVYRSTDGSRGTLIGTPTTTSFPDSGLTNGTTYSYTVTAVNAAGEGPGAQTNATPRTKPGAPTSVTATAQNTAVTLSWSAPTDDGGAAITGYTVYRSTTSGAVGNAVAHPTTTVFDDTGLTNGTTYYYTVTATNAAGDGPGSSQVSATPRAVPDAPAGLTATPGNTAVSLTWTAPASNGNPISGYTVYRSTDGSRGSVVATPTTTSFDDTGLTNGTTYFYTVTATNSAGAGPDSAQTSATPRTRPSAPLGVTATPGDSSVSLTWSAPTDNGGAPVTAYNVYRSTDGSTGVLVGTPTTTSFTDTGLSNGTTYVYSVTATNAAGEGPSSGTASASPATTPAPPASVSATATDRRADLTWAPPATDGGRAVTSYAVYRSTDGTSWTLVATTAATSWADTAVTDGVMFSYAVSARNAMGEGGRSGAVTAMPHGGATVTITNAPASPTSSSSATFGFATTDPNGLAVATTCSLDGAGGTPCSSGQTFAGLGDGVHTLTVTARDAAGPGGDATYSWVVDTTAPTTTLRTLPTVSLGVISLRWSATDAGAGVSSYDVRYRRAGRNGRFGAWTYPSGWQQRVGTTVTRAEARGYTDCFAVRTRDAAGNVSAWTSMTCTTLPLDDRALARSLGWSRQTGSRYYAGTVTATTRSGQSLTAGNVGARRIALIATKCRSCGSVRVYLAGRLIGTVSLRASRTTRHAVIWLPAFSRRTGTVTIRVATSGRLVQIDGLAALP